MAFLVIGDRALADELSRALAPLGEDVIFAVSFFAETLPTPLTAVVLSESTTADQAAVVASIVARAQGGLAPVWRVGAAGAEVREDRGCTSIPRAALVPAARTLIGASDKHRVPVQILARWRRQGDDETSRRLANIVGLSERAMIVEIDEPLEEGVGVDLSFIIPGASQRVALGGVVRECVDERRMLRRVEVASAAPDDQQALRAFLQRRLAR